MDLVVEVNFREEEDSMSRDHQSALNQSNRIEEENREMVESIIFAPVSLLEWRIPDDPNSAKLIHSTKPPKWIDYLCHC